MKNPPEMAYFETVHADGLPVAVHAKAEKCNGLTEITPEQALAIKAERVARRPKAASVQTIRGDGPGDPPVDLVANLEDTLRARDEAFADILSGLDQRLTQVVAALADLTNLTSVRFQMIAAEQDETPSYTKYPDLGQVLDLPDGAQPEDWKDAIARFKAGGA